MMSMSPLGELQTLQVGGMHHCLHGETQARPASDSEMDVQEALGPQVQEGIREDSPTHQGYE